MLGALLVADLPARLLSHGRLRRVVAPAHGPAHPGTGHGSARGSVHVHQRGPPVGRPLLAIPGRTRPPLPRWRRQRAGPAQGARRSGHRLADLGRACARAPARGPRSWPGCPRWSCCRGACASGRNWPRCFFSPAFSPCWHARRATASAVALASPAGSVGQLPRLLRARPARPRRLSGRSWPPTRVWRTAAPVARPPLQDPRAGDRRDSARLSWSIPTGGARSVCPSSSSASWAAPAIYRATSANSRPSAISSPPAGLWNPYLLAFFVVLGLGHRELRAARPAQAACIPSACCSSSPRPTWAGRPPATAPCSRWWRPS